MNVYFRKTLTLGSALVLGIALAVPAVAADMKGNPCAPMAGNANAMKQSGANAMKGENPCKQAHNGKAMKKEKSHVKKQSKNKHKMENPCAMQPGKP